MHVFCAFHQIAKPLPAKRRQRLLYNQPYAKISILEPIAPAAGAGASFGTIVLSISLADCSDISFALQKMLKLAWVCTLLILIPIEVAAISISFHPSLFCDFSVSQPYEMFK